MTEQELQIALDVMLMKGCKCECGRAGVLAWIREQENIESLTLLQALTVVLPSKVNVRKWFYESLWPEDRPRHRALAIGIIRRMSVNQRMPVIEYRDEYREGMTAPIDRFPGWFQSEVDLSLVMDGHELENLQQVMHASYGRVGIMSIGGYDRPFVQSWDGADDRANLPDILDMDIEATGEISDE